MVHARHFQQSDNRTQEMAGMICGEDHNAMQGRKEAREATAELVASEADVGKQQVTLNQEEA